MRRSMLPLMLLLAPGALAAQLPNTSIRALGLGGAYTVNARGFEAAAWNPAALGVRGRPGFTLGLPAGSLEFGSSAYGFGDFRKYADKSLTAQDKADLLAKIDSTLDIRTIGGASLFGLSIGRFALSIGTAGNFEGRLGKDAVDLALNGNASDPTRVFTARGTRFDGWGATTAAVSFGWPLMSSPLGRLSVGATGKKVWGHALARAAETASSFQVNPNFQANAAGHAIYTSYSGGDFSATDSPGNGFGVDLGGVLELPGGLTVGASIVNIVSSMSWDSDRLRYERTSRSISESGGTVTDDSTRLVLVGSAIDADPVAKAFRDSLLEHAGFARLVRAGASLRLAGILLEANGQLRLSDGLDHPPSQYASAGAEYVLLGILPLRVGIGSDFAKQLTLSAGTGLHLGPVHLDIGAANITGSNNPGVRVGAGLSLMF